MVAYQFLDDFLIPDRIALAFKGRTSLTLAEAADALEMDARHLRDAANNGRIHYVQLTRSGSRKMRRFLLNDVIDFLKSERRRDCQPVNGRARRATGTDPGPTLSPFKALRERLNKPQTGSGRLKRS